MKGDSPTGWVAYVRAYKTLHPDTEPNYKELMQQYIKGIRLDETHEGEPV